MFVKNRARYSRTRRHNLKVSKKNLNSSRLHLTKYFLYYVCIEATAQDLRNDETSCCEFFDEESIQVWKLLLKRVNIYDDEPCNSI
ncbi:hypothetical protein HanRHA438_Chr09g0391471 [Helianthus annuus]|nr:hypothetical protein HanHA300_Chr09g0311751 [Helianthus annuus]KAJ0541800.1 hypothetical protein HanHA89_Chr09g0332631 [Helianthus annuus]KAJ0706876.1 hypothetical protein HanLR1_Chr09g0312091 [Helianthus annuus]KAJ0710894.1 hypothetical protein HanOQP8_Chr09g0317651 [Helianthus annuus]KAJ0887496.1 hypothetical protein HanRHA438_Chr09g0391471 [Helianthus annuus]